MQRTHQLLRQALISLILERGYHAVTIRDVVKRAGVGRSTFYVHFGDLEELMRSHGAGEGLRRFMGPGRKGDKHPFAFSLAFLEHANGQRRLWRALIGNKGGEALRKHFKEELIEIVREDVLRAVGRQRPEWSEATARYISGAFAELVFWWLDSQPKIAPADLDCIFHSLTAGALATKRTVAQHLLRQAWQECLSCAGRHRSNRCRSGVKPLSQRAQVSPNPRVKETLQRSTAAEQS